nr:unnamed protein product [Spirometra erinaceieuropaei]
MVSKRKAVTPDEDSDAYYVSVKDLPFDILRQRIAQSSGAERREARKQLLLKMGAKPEKRGYVNYRLLMEEKKAAKAASIADYHNERFKKTTLERQLGVSDGIITILFCRNNFEIAVSSQKLQLLGELVDVLSAFLSAGRKAIAGEDFVFRS